MGCNLHDQALDFLNELGFSTLYGSKWVATIHNGTQTHNYRGFSTLYGSKWVATTGCRQCAPFCVMFQYPLRVEVGCNLSGRFGVVLHSEVSVPSTGRSGLQPVVRFHWRVQDEVSVPSTGRSGLQPVIPPLGVPVCQVSVPSTGRSGLQLECWSVRRYICVSFSTLYGSKWVATWDSATYQSAPEQFQYPLRVEVGCNFPPSLGLFIPQTFQYPLRVEVGCN